MRATCERAGCDRPQHAAGLCGTHYRRERDQGRKRPRHERVLFTRARNRATAKLVKLHPDEFAELLAAERVNVEAEHAQLLKLAAEAGVEPTAGVVRIRRGPASIDGEAVEDRALFVIDGTVCEPCGTFHAGSHQPGPCKVCGTRQRSVASMTPTERIERLIRAGKSVQWIAANLGEPVAAVRAVLDGMIGKSAAS